MSDFLFKDRDGQTPLPPELQKGLKIKTIQTIGELDEYEEDNIAKGLSWLARQKANMHSGSSCTKNSSNKSGLGPGKFECTSWPILISRTRMKSGPSSINLKKTWSSGFQMRLYPVKKCRQDFTKELKLFTPLPMAMGALDESLQNKYVVTTALKFRDGEQK